MMNLTMPDASPFAQLTSKEEQESSEEGIERIVGGRHADMREAPYAVMVRLFGNQICGGTIVSPNHVVTSAHCVCYPGIAIYTLIPGSSLRNSGIALMRVVNKINQNPAYNPRTLKGDVAVVRTNTPLSINHRTISIAMLPPPGICEQMLPNTIGLIAGW